MAPVRFYAVFPPLQLPNWIALATFSDSTSLITLASHFFLPAS